MTQLAYNMESSIFDFNPFTISPSRPVLKPMFKLSSPDSPSSKVVSPLSPPNLHFRNNDEEQIDENILDTKYQFKQLLYDEPLFGTQVSLYYDEDSQQEFILKRVSKTKLRCEEHVISARRELSIHRHLSHPNIVTIFDCQETDQDFVMLMEYVQNHNYFVDKIEVNNNPFSLKPDGGVQKLKSFCFDILQGLSYLESSGIVHMDIKPANLLLQPQSDADQYPLVKICDFGLSRQLGPDGTVQIPKRCGTEQYIAPEVVNSGVVTSKVDMWSFGLFLHILTVGYSPFALNWKPGSELRFPPRYWRKYAETGLMDLIAQCLQKNPSQRISATQALTHPFLMTQLNIISRV